MTSSPARPWLALSPLRRFGPLALVVVLVVVVVTLEWSSWLVMAVLSLVL